jgi:hypothetical protein
MRVERKEESKTSTGKERNKGRERRESLKEKAVEGTHPLLRYFRQAPPFSSFFKSLHGSLNNVKVLTFYRSKKSKTLTLHNT